MRSECKNTQIRYSAVKLLSCECLIAVMIFWPMMPGFSDGLVYTKALFSPGMSIFRWVAECIGFAMLLYLMPLIAHAIRGKPMFETVDSIAHVNLIRTRSFQIADVISLEPQKGGNALLRLANSPPVVVPIFLSPNRRDALSLLQGLAAL